MEKYEYLKKSPVQSSSVLLTLQTDSSPEKDQWLEERGASEGALRSWSEATMMTIKERRMKKTTSAWAGMFTHLTVVGEEWFSHDAAFDLLQRSETQQRCTRCWEDNKLRRRKQQVRRFTVCGHRNHIEKGVHSFHLFYAEVHSFYDNDAARSSLSLLHSSTDEIFT